MDLNELNKIEASKDQLKFLLHNKYMSFDKSRIDYDIMIEDIEKLISEVKTLNEELTKLKKKGGNKKCQKLETQD